jgi:hypothetical protein
MNLGKIMSDEMRVASDFAQGNLPQGLRDEAQLFQDAMKKCDNDGDNDGDDKSRHHHHQNPLQMLQQLFGFGGSGE